jgi:branched-chain amino acid transport system permease protein
MSFFFQELVNGITTGALYALVALGFSMVYGVLKLLNFAHGDLYMVGAYIGFFVIQFFGGSASLSIAVPLLLVIMFVVAAGLVGGLGVAIERFAYRPLRDAPRIAPLITAIGVSFFLESSALLLFGAQYRVYNTSEFISLSSGIRIGSVTIDSVQILVLVMGLVLMTGLRILVNRTRLGKQMRAVAVDREAAEMLGINVNFVITATFLLGSALAGIAGVIHRRTQGVHRGRGRRDRLDTRRDARRPGDRRRGIDGHRLHLLHLYQPDRIRAADRRDAGPAERAARPRAAAEGVSEP